MPKKENEKNSNKNDLTANFADRDIAMHLIVSICLLCSCMIYLNLSNGYLKSFAYFFTLGAMLLNLAVMSLKMEAPSGFEPEMNKKKNADNKDENNEINMSKQK